MYSDWFSEHLLANEVQITLIKTENQFDYIIAFPLRMQNTPQSLSNYYKQRIRNTC